jgi:hypothetical protein
MKLDCEKLVDSYLKWLRTRITTASVNGSCEITTPFLDRHNDRLQIYVLSTPTGLRLTDDGFIIGDLESSGCQLDTSQRQDMLRTILNGFGVQEIDGELTVDAAPGNFPQKKHALVQAMLAVNDMFMTGKHRVASLFVEDVQAFLEANSVRFTPEVEFTGKSGFVQRFDFVIPKTQRQPERILRAINQPTRDSATALMFAWSDTKDVRPDPNSRAYAVLNDADKSLNPDLVEALHHYEIRAIPWSQRDQFVSELAG